MLATWISTDVKAAVQISLLFLAESSQLQTTRSQTLGYTRTRYEGILWHFRVLIGPIYAKYFYSPHRWTLFQQYTSLILSPTTSWPLMCIFPYSRPTWKFRPLALLFSLWQRALHIRSSFTSWLLHVSNLRSLLTARATHTNDFSFFRVLEHAGCHQSCRTQAHNTPL